MGWSTDVVPSQFDSVVAVMVASGVELGPIEEVTTVDCGRSTFTTRRVMFRHATSGETLVLEDYQSEYMSWDSGDRYVFSVIVHEVGQALPDCEVRNLIYEEQVRSEIDKMENIGF